MTLKSGKLFVIALVGAIMATPCLHAATATDAADQADADYRRMATKAARFFNEGEWLNANAMYTLMLDQRPDVASTYAHAVMTNVMLNDTAAVSRVIAQSMAHNVPIDTLLNDVHRLSTRAGIADLYERLLVSLRGQFPWMQRSLNSYLLKYYTYRDNGPEMVHYARLMLQGLPDSKEFNSILARGYMLTGQYDEAVKTWVHILAVHPEDYDTLLALGNYYAAAGNMRTARPYLELAQAKCPTPYVAKLLASSARSHD